MFEMKELTLLSPGSWIVVLHPGERERFVELNLGLPVGHRSCWVSIGDTTRMNLKDLGNIAGLV